MMAAADRSLRRVPRFEALAADEDDSRSIFPPKNFCATRGGISAFRRRKQKNRHRKFCCRFHHSLPDPLGDQMEVSVHRVNSWRPMKTACPGRARPMPESATPLNGTFAMTLFVFRKF